MPNTLTNLIPDIYSALDIVGRERVGMISAVHVDAQAARAAVNEVVRVPIAPAHASETITPGSTPPNTGDQTWTNATITITNQKAVPFRYTGEEQRGLNNGPGYRSLQALNIAQALRTLTNDVEGDLSALYTSASRAYGTAGTAPFATADDLSDSANVLRILEDNGAPGDDLQLVLSPAAMTNVRGKMSNLFKSNEAGTDELLREGMISGGLHGMAVRLSKQMPGHTKGSGTSYQLAETGEVTETALNVDTGSGTIVAGDVVTFAGAGAAQRYVVGTALTGGVVTLNAPGLVSAEADNAALTVGNSYTANLAFHRQAIVLAARQPALPEEGDSAAERMTITDPVSGLAFEFAIYREYRRVRYEIALAWGVAAIKPEHIALLLG